MRQTQGASTEFIGVLGKVIFRLQMGKQKLHVDVGIIPIIFALFLVATSFVDPVVKKNFLANRKVVSYNYKQEPALFYTFLKSEVDSDDRIC